MDRSTLISKYRSFLSFVLLAFGILLLVAGCGGSAPEPQPTEPSEAASVPTATSEPQATEASSGEGEAAEVAVGGQEIVIRFDDDIVDIDPASLRTSVDYEIARQVFCGLVKYNSEDVTAPLQPDLAEEWSVSDDGLVYTFKLREGVQWHKGYGEVTAEDVKFSIERHFDEDVASRYLSEVAVIDRVEVVNDHEVEIHLKQPWPGLMFEFLAYRPGYILNQQAVEDAGDQFTAEAVGCGPFILDEWVPNDRIVLTANPDYHGDTGKISKATYVIMEEDSLFEIALEAGDVDIGYVITPDSQASVLQNENIKTITSPAPQTMYIVFNMDEEPWNDVRVRQALWYATDRQAIIDNIFNGIGKVSDTLYNPLVYGYTDSLQYEYDPERAKQLLAEAGYPDGLDGTFIIYNLESWPEAATALQSIWKESGINVDIETFEGVQIFEKYREGSFDFGAMAITRVGPDQIVRGRFHSANVPFPNMSRYENPEMDDLIDGAQTEVDDEKRLEMYQQVTDLIREDVPVIPLYQSGYVLAMRPEVQGAIIPGFQAFDLTKLSIEE